MKSERAREAGMWLSWRNAKELLCDATFVELEDTQR